MTEWNDILESDVCWEGMWYDICDAECRFKAGDMGLKVCPWCNDVVGYKMIECGMCHIRESQCKLVRLYGVCRFKEDHACGFPEYVLCKECFINAKKQMIDMRISHFPKVLYEIFYKYLDDNWKEFQE